MLIVQSGADYVGFVVPRVRSIVQATWNPTLPARGAIHLGAGLIKTPTLALVGEGDDERMLRVLDLAGAALALRAAAPPVCREAA